MCPYFSWDTFFICLNGIYYSMQTKMQIAIDGPASAGKKYRCKVGR